MKILLGVILATSLVPANSYSKASTIVNVKSDMPAKAAPKPAEVQMSKESFIEKVYEKLAEMFNASDAVEATVTSLLKGKDEAYYEVDLLWKYNDWELDRTTEYLAIKKQTIKGYGDIAPGNINAGYKVALTLQDEVYTSLLWDQNFRVELSHPHESGTWSSFNDVVVKISGKRTILKAYNTLASRPRHSVRYGELRPIGNRNLKIIEKLKKSLAK